MSEAATEQTTNPGGDEQGTVSVPRREVGERQPENLVAVWPGPPDPETGERPHQLKEGADVIPDEVAEELGLSPGQTLSATILPPGPRETARLAKAAADPRGHLDPFDLLQVVFDRCVKSTNFNMHKSDQEGYNQLRVNDVDAEEFLWWLYGWSGAGTVMGRLTRPQQVLNEKKKRKRS